jgi:hypothetical protein
LEKFFGGRKAVIPDATVCITVYNSTHGMRIAISAGDNEYRFQMLLAFTTEISFALTPDEITFTFI